MSKTTPVNRLVIYRPKTGKYAELESVLKKHGPVLRQTGLITEEPVRLYRATDLRRHGEPEPYFVETFQWKDSAASDAAHQTPEVMAVWETMGPHMEGMTLTTLEPIAP
jgi:quinol monooxygenase YgiN